MQDSAQDRMRGLLRRGWDGPQAYLSSVVGIPSANEWDGGSERIATPMMTHASRIPIALKNTIIDKRVIGRSPLR